MGGGRGRTTGKLSHAPIIITTAAPPTPLPPPFNPPPLRNPTNQSDNGRQVKFLEKVGESSSGGKKEEHRKEVRWRKAAAELSLLGLIKKGGGGGKDLERDALVWTK